jgi:hypothetical protein
MWVDAVPLTSHTATGSGRTVASFGSQPHGGRAFERHTRPDPRRYESRNVLASHPPSGHSARVDRDGLPVGWTLDRVREVGQLRDAPYLLDRGTPVTLDTPAGHQAIDPSVLIECGGLILVLDSVENEWLMGQQADDGSVLCWSSYGADLEFALKSL